MSACSCTISYDWGRLTAAEPGITAATVGGTAGAEVDANAAQIPQLIAQSLQTVPAATAPPLIVSHSATQRPPGMCECMYK